MTSFDARLSCAIAGVSFPNGLRFFGFGFQLQVQYPHDDDVDQHADPKVRPTDCLGQHGAKAVFRCGLPDNRPHGPCPAQGTAAQTDQRGKILLGAGDEATGGQKGPFGRGKGTPHPFVIRRHAGQGKDTYSALR